MVDQAELVGVVIELVYGVREVFVAVAHKGAVVELLVNDIGVYSEAPDFLCLGVPEVSAYVLQAFQYHLSAFIVNWSTVHTIAVMHVSHLSITI